MSIKKDPRGWNSFLRYARRGTYIHGRIQKMCPELATPALAAKILKCPESLIMRAIKKRKLIARLLGKFYAIDKESLWGFYAVYYRKVRNGWALKV